MLGALASPPNALASGHLQSATDQAASSGDVLGSSHFSPVVSNLDQSIEFYQTVLGVTVAPAKQPGPRPWDTQQSLRNLQGYPDTLIRYAVAPIPGERWGVELIEFQDGNRQLVRPRVQDPGATTLILLVRDVDAAFARVKLAGARIITGGGGPVAIDQGTRAVLFTDPDGHFIELRQPAAVPETTAPPSANVIGARVRITVDSMDSTLHLYRDLFGLQFQAPTAAVDEAFARLTGVAGARFRRSAIAAPMSLEFLEIQGVERTPMRTRIVDPGSTKYPLRVRDLDAALEKLKSTGAVVVSTGGEPVIVRNVKYAIVRDLNNVFIIMTQVPPAPSHSP